MEECDKVELVADALIYKFLKKGIIVHKRHSKKTNTIYIKLDYGLGRTIRVSDHPLKGSRFYYNIVSGVSFKEIKRKGRLIYYFPLDVEKSSINKIKRKIISDIHSKVNKMGIKEYSEKVNLRKLESITDNSMKGYRLVSKMRR